MAEVEELTPEQIAALEAEIATLQTKINEQGDSIKELKKNNADRATVMEAVNQLNGLKAEKTKLSNRLFPPKVLEMNREEMADALTRRFFLCPAFSIYGGFKGLFDLGPPGCAIKANLLNYWRQFFVLEDNMLEVDTTSLTPDIVLRVSGHEAKFKDLMVKDVVTGTCHRADHLLEDHLDTLLKNPGLSEELANEYRTVAGLADDYSPEELHEKLTKYNIKAPDTGNDITAPFPFNLMFQTQIGPTGDSFGYMRPETAQGIFVNFPRLLEFNGGKLPFAGACIGTAFRNEISPRNGLLRVREFQLAEIEHFMLPNETDHPKYDTVTDVVLSLYSRGQQKTGTGRTLRRTVAQAVAEGLILNQTHAYYIARVQQFLLDIGIRRTGLRFRQHLENEKAHYASDCWDAEILTSYGWIECVGIADRSDFDLTQHSNHTGARMSVHVPFPDGPRLVDALEVKPDKKTIGQKYGKKANHLFEFLAGLSTDEAKSLQEKLAAGPADVTVKYVEKPDKKAGPHAVGQECVETFTLEAGMVTFSPIKKKETGSNVLPIVIEPSFGVGRILYSLLEHAYQVRPDDAQKKYFSLSPVVAPLKCVILPLLSTDELKAPAQRIARLLAHNNVSYKIDDVGKSIGRRYARADELGIPFGVTIDHTTLQNDTVTVRERDTTLQVRIKIDELAPLLSDIIQGRTTWVDVRAQPEKYPHVDPVADDEEGSSSKA